MTTNGAIHPTNMLLVSLISVINVMIAWKWIVNSLHYHKSLQNQLFTPWTHKEKNFPCSKKSLLQQKTKMFHFLCSRTHVFSFFGLLLCHFVLGRVLSTIDTWHCRCRWFTLSAFTINAQHYRCKWFTFLANIIDTWHWRHRVVNTSNLHYSDQRPWTPQPFHQIHSSVCWWIIKEVHLLLYQLILFQNIQDFKRM